MAESYLKRLDVAYPQLANPRGIYAVRILENDDLDVLQDIVNLYLLALPSSTTDWHPDIISVEYDNYTTVPPMPTVMHVCTILIFAVGTITAPPT